MIALHSLWSSIYGEPIGSGRGKPRRVTRESARAKGPRNRPAAYQSIWALAEGLALFRSGHLLAAEKTFSQFQLRTGSARVVWVAAKCWQGMALAIAGKPADARRRYNEARVVAAKITDCDQSFSSLLGLTEALIQYKSGDHEGSLKTLDGIRSSFYSTFEAMLLEFPLFEAEALLLRAKALRELGLYEQALLVLDRCQLLRRKCTDDLGESWCCLEKARIHRFREEYDQARLELEAAAHLLNGTDFLDWQARVADQQGDICRTQGDLDEAERWYQKAASLAQHSDNRILHAHLANSFARLWAERGRPEKALEFLGPHAGTWKETKSYGKFLYLQGSIQARMGNTALAEKLLIDAIESLRRFGLRSYEALAQDCLARLLLDSGRRVEACRAWAEALRKAEEVEARKFLEAIQKGVNQLRALDLVPLISTLWAELAAYRSRVRQDEAEAREAQTKHFIERHIVGHWCIRPVRRHLWPTDKQPTMLAPFLRDFCAILDNADWSTQDFARSPAQPTEEVDVTSLLRECSQSVSTALRTKIEVKTSKALPKIKSNHMYLRCALMALLRGIHTAFGTRELRVSIRESKADRFRYSLSFTLAHPKPKGFEFAARLVPVDTVGDDEQLLAFFQKKGYTGDLTLAQFLVDVTLWGRLEFVPDRRSVMVKLPNLEKKEA